jgi:hypothetical protein
MDRAGCWWRAVDPIPSDGTTRKMAEPAAPGGRERAVGQPTEEAGSLFFLGFADPFAYIV